jgi:hypothetical protein
MVSSPPMKRAKQVGPAAGTGAETAMTRDRTTAPLVLAALLSLSCGGGKPAAPPPPAAAAQLSTAEAQARAVARIGVRPELGASADALFADLDTARLAALAGMPAPLLAAPRQPASALSSPTTAATTGPVGASITSSLAVLLLLVEPGVNQAGVNNRTGTRHDDLPGGAADTTYITTLTQSGSTLAAGISQTVVYTAKDGRTITELTTGSAQLQLCPDAAGRVPITYTFHFDVKTPGGGAQVDVSGTGAGTVGDDAGLLSWSSDSTTSFAAQGSALPVTGSNGTVRVQQSFDWASAVQTSHTTTVVRDTTVASVVAGLQDIASTMPGLLSRILLEKAQAHWQGGECVEILVAGAGDANDVAANSTTSFTGTVHHKIDGVDLPLPISAALSGTQSIAPTAPTSSPVSYVYVAGSNDGVLSTVALETRSRRGVGKKPVAFSTKVLTAWAGTLGFSCTSVTASSVTTWAGSSTVRLVNSSTGGGGAIYNPDPASGSTTFTGWTSDTTDSSGETCTLVGTASSGPAQLSGSLVLLATPPQYEFFIMAQATATLRCVKKLDNSVRTVSTGVFSQPTTFTAPGVVTWVPVTTASLLSGAAHYHAASTGAAMDCDNTWSLAAQ